MGAERPLRQTRFRADLPRDMRRVPHGSKRSTNSLRERPADRRRCGAARARHCDDLDWIADPGRLVRGPADLLKPAAESRAHRHRVHGCGTSSRASTNGSIAGGQASINCPLAIHRAVAPSVRPLSRSVRRQRQTRHPGSPAAIVKRADAVARRLTAEPLASLDRGGRLCKKAAVPLSCRRHAGSGGFAGQSPADNAAAGR